MLFIILISIVFVVLVGVQVIHWVDIIAKNVAKMELQKRIMNDLIKNVAKRKGELKNIPAKDIDEDDVGYA